MLEFHEVNCISCGVVTLMLFMHHHNINNKGSALLLTNHVLL